MPSWTSRRWSPPFIAAKRAIDRGELGFVTRAARLNNSIDSPTSRLGWSGQTTSARFLGSHCLDLAYSLHGRRAMSVYAFGVTARPAARGIDTCDAIPSRLVFALLQHALVRCEDGTDGAFESVSVSR